MKRSYFLIVIVLTAAMALFGAYLVLIQNLKDTKPPVITVAEELLEISVEDGNEILMTGITAMDDRDGDVTASLLVESIYGITEDHVTTVTYAAFDRAGNVSKIQRKVHYTDYREPRFEFAGSLSFPHNSKFDLLDYVGAHDVLEGDIRRRVRATLVSDTRSIDELGSHVVRLQVTNSLGDTEELVIGVEVYPAGKYNATLSLTDYIVYLRVGESFSAEAYLNKFTMYGQTVSLRTGVGEDLQLQITGVVDTGKAGVYPVSYTVTRQYGNQLYAGYSRLIVVVEE